MRGWRWSVLQRGSIEMGCYATLGEVKGVLTKGQMGSETMLMLKVAMVDSRRWNSRLVELNMRGNSNPDLKTLIRTIFPLELC